MPLSAALNFRGEFGVDAMRNRLGLIRRLVHCFITRFVCDAWRSDIKSHDELDLSLVPSNSSSSPSVIGVFRHLIATCTSWSVIPMWVIVCQTSSDSIPSAFYSRLTVTAVDTQLRD